MAKVTKYDVTPPPVPVAEVFKINIKGLTANQARLIRDLLGKVSTGDNEAYDVYYELSTAIGDSVWNDDSHYMFTADHNHDGRVSLISVFSAPQE